MNEKFTIVLTVSEWNAILSILAKQSYEVSANLIQQIQAQAQQQTQNAAPVPPMTSFLPNGSAAEAAEGGH